MTKDIEQRLIAMSQVRRYAANGEVNRISPEALKIFIAEYDRVVEQWGIEVEKKTKLQKAIITVRELLKRIQAHGLEQV